MVGYPVLAQQWDELFGVFVGEVHASAVDRVDGNRRRDEVGESMRPFGFEEIAVHRRIDGLQTVRPRRQQLRGRRITPGSR